MCEKFVVIMLWGSSELVSKSFDSETDCWNHADELQRLANENNFNVVYTVRNLSEVVK